MKQFLLMFLFLFTTTFSFSQTWKELKTENGVKVEYSIQPNDNNTIEYVVFKLTNIESTDKDINVTLNFDYGNGLRPTDDDYHIILNPNTPILGDVSTRYLALSKRFLNNSSKTTLINFDVEIQTN